MAVWAWFGKLVIVRFLGKAGFEVVIARVGDCLVD